MRRSGVRLPPCAGLLHTATIHAEPFDRLVAAAAPDADRLHVVDPGLLATAIRTGVTPELYAAVARHVEHLVAGGATAVLVTCSSIGEAVEAIDAVGTVDTGDVRVPVLRVDEPMAREAATTGGRITVLATLRSTLAPTTRLIRRYAEDADVTAEVVPGAADARAGGDIDEHDELIRKAIAAAQADVVVLAQATMAAAATGTGVRVLTSPDSGVAALAEALQA